MNSSFLLAFLLFTILTVSGQNIKRQGLKTGLWKEKELYSGNVSKGIFKIIPRSQYSVIRELGRNSYEVKFRASTPLLFYDSASIDSLAVKDGLWETHDNGGNLRREDFWIEGLNQWTRYYDSFGNLTKSDFDDYDNDTNFYFTYKDGQLFKKGYYPPENKNRITEIYYPEELLVFSDAELSFNIDFLGKPLDTQTFSVYAKEDLRILSISPLREFTTINFMENEPVCYPLLVKAGESITLKVAVAPTSAQYQFRDTLTIFTDKTTKPFRVYSAIYGHHLDARTVAAMKKIQLSRSKDRFLVISPMGTVTEAFITIPPNEEIYYDINKITKIDLGRFLPGSYRLEIASCHTGGMMTLVITE